MERKKKLSLLLELLDVTGRTGNGNPVIRGIAYDSRRAERGFLFVALRGLHTDGHKYLEAARSRGAAACLVEDITTCANLEIPCIAVNDTRTALSRIAARFFDEPSRALCVIGVTGTDGKSTTVSLIHQLLELSGYRSGFLSTVAYKAEDIVADNPFRQSTPEAPEIHEMLARMVRSHKQFAVIEATSHGLSSLTGRLADVFFDDAVFTNIAHEHLEFHGTLERYRDDKANLFRALDRPGEKNHRFPRCAVVNGDDPHWDFFTAATKTPALVFGIKNADADLRASSLLPDQSGTAFIIQDKTDTVPAYLPLPGVFNVENLLAAAAVVLAVTGMSLPKLVPLFAGLKPVSGRMESVERGQSFRVIVDFAHTPQAFAKLLPLLRRETAGRLIVVFGSAGMRDREKRAMQGEIASRSADIVILTDEDPREEDSLAILEAIASGCLEKERDKNLFLIPDRREAIRKAFSLAGLGDSVLLLGKGHEKSIIYKDHVLDWNEKTVAEQILAEMGFTGIV
jgi:UDP-N-acetylmuramoyl-L-alanyl-D-glutamate--2,6-diaminopimelate ligase